MNFLIAARQKFPQFSYARQKENHNMVIFCRDNPTTFSWCHSTPIDSKEQKIYRQTKNFHNFPMPDKRKTRKFDFRVVIIPWLHRGTIRRTLTPMNRKPIARQKISTIFRCQTKGKLENSIFLSWSSHTFTKVSFDAHWLQLTSAPLPDKIYLELWVARQKENLKIEIVTVWRWWVIIIRAFIIIIFGIIVFVSYLIFNTIFKHFDHCDKSAEQFLHIL